MIVRFFYSKSVTLTFRPFDGGGDGTENNFGPISIIRPYMNPIHPRVWK